MHAIRQYYDDAPSAIAIPEWMRHKKLVVIFQVEEMQEAQKSQIPLWREPKGNLKTLLLAMPNVGDDADFIRPLDYGRDSNGRGVAWDF